MNKNIFLILTLIIASLTACTPRESPPDVIQPAKVTVIPAATQTPSAVPTAEVASPSDWFQYTNTEYGLGFRYPSDWYGPEEYISEPVLRVEIGSDIVYPYGTDPTDRVYNHVNSYSIVIQYSRSEQNDVLSDTYQMLESLQDGESFSDTRVTITRVRQFILGNYTGYEYTATLSETAQTERFYSREIILVDDQSHVLTVFGSPNNVEVAEGNDWRMVFQQIDEENLPTFHEILNSLDIQ